MLYQVENWERYNPRNDYKGLPWFRCQSDLLYEDKLFGLGPDQKFLWPCILGLAAKQNKRGLVELDPAYLALYSGVTEARVLAALEHFVAKGLLAIGARSEDVRGPVVTWPAPDREAVAPRTDDDRLTYAPRTDHDREPIASRSDHDQITFATERNGTERNESTPHSPAVAGRTRKGRSPPRITRAQADRAWAELVAFGTNRPDAGPLSTLAERVIEWRYGSESGFRTRYVEAHRNGQMGAFEVSIQRACRDFAKQANNQENRA